MFDPAKDIPDGTGKTFLITGGTAGLGAGSVLNLAQHGSPRIFFTGRNKRSADALIAQAHSKNANATLTFLECDMTSLRSVQGAASAFLAQSEQLDVLMCNAGIMAVDEAVTPDGFEVQFQVNHLSHALLINLLLPTLKQTAAKTGDARIVSMASVAYQQAPAQGIDFATLRSNQAKLGNAINPGHKWARYGQSKLANLLYVTQLASHHPNVTSVAIHPGYVMTGLFNGVSFFTKLPALILSIGKKTPVEQGPYTQLWASTCPKEKLTNGEYYEPVGVKGSKTTKQAKDGKLAEELWRWTQEALAEWNKA